MGGAHLVVDGSNIATEGRSMPSLQQLLDAVDAVTKEFSYDNVTVIVDATFGHRIDKDERDGYEERVNTGKIITPPAGVIGRGDAFILEVADRADAVVLSNDSFQEFHGTYDWLFTEGRLLGGKHVPGVGWIFLARSPVRGPTSRRAVSDAKRKRRGSKQAAPAKPATKKSSGRSKKSASKSTRSSGSSRSKATAASSAEKDTGRKRGGKEPEPYNEPLPFIEFVGAHPVGSIIEAEIEQFSSHGAYVLCDGTRCYISLKSIADPPPRSAREVFDVGDTVEFVVRAIDTPRRGIDLAMPGVADADADGASETDGDETVADETETASGGRGGRQRSRGKGRSSGRASPDDGADADTEAAASDNTKASSGTRSSGTSAPTPADAGDRKLSVSQRRKLRAQEAADAEKAAATAASAVEPTDSATRPAGPARKAGSRSTTSKRTATAKKAAAKKTAAKKSRAAKKTATKKATTRKTASKKTAAKTATAKKTTARKATAKKAAAKKSTAKKSTAKKSAAKKATAKKSTAKKSTAKKSTAKKAAAKKSPAKKTTPRKRAAKKAPVRKSTGSSSKPPSGSDADDS